MTRQGSLLPAYAALAASMAIVGANVPLAKYLGSALPVDLIVAGRCLAATLALAPLVWLGAGFGGLVRERWALVGLGLAGVVGYPLLMVTGLKWTDALAAGAITATMPAVVALLSVWFLKERLSVRTWGAVALAVAGVTCLNVFASGSEAASRATLWGNMIIMAAILCEAAYVIQSKPLAGRMPALKMTFGINLAGVLLTAPVAIGTLLFEPPTRVPGLAVGGVIWYGLSSSVIALVLWFWGMARVPAARAGLFTVFLPLTAALISVAFLGERAAGGQWLGVALVLAALALAAEPGQKAPAPELPLPRKLASSQTSSALRQSESAPQNE